MFLEIKFASGEINYVPVGPTHTVTVAADGVAPATFSMDGVSAVALVSEAPDEEQLAAEPVAAPSDVETGEATPDDETNESPGAATTENDTPNA